MNLRTQCLEKGETIDLGLNLMEKIDSGPNLGIDLDPNLMAEKETIPTEIGQVLEGISMIGIIDIVLTQEISLKKSQISPPNM